MLSELEAIYFFLVERRVSTVDIREQWPILDIDRTLDLSTEYGVRHGIREGFPEPFTIDFMISEAVDGEIRHRAASVKSPEDARNPLVRIRLAVENAWCRERGIPWTLVDTTKFDKTLLENLRFMRAWFRQRYTSEPLLEGRFAEQFGAAYQPNRRLDEQLQQLSRTLRRPLTLMEDVFRYCVWSGRIRVSLTHQLSLDRPVVLLRDSSRD